MSFSFFQKKMSQFATIAELQQVCQDRHFAVPIEVSEEDSKGRFHSNIGLRQDNEEECEKDPTIVYAETDVPRTAEEIILKILHRSNGIPPEEIHIHEDVLYYNLCDN